MQAHALEALEFDRVLDAVAAYATSEPGADSVRYLTPVSDPEAVARQLDEVDEMVGWLMREDEWAPPVFPDLSRSLETLGIEGSVWTEPELARAQRLMLAARAVRRSLTPPPPSFPILGEIAEGLIENDEVQQRLGEALDAETEVLKDGASPELMRLRRSLKTTRIEIIELLEKLMSGLPDRIGLSDASVTLRNGRYCIPIRREGRSEVGGIVHDESASRATLFVEPPAAIEPMNRLRELELAEVREIGRILTELTDMLRPHADELGEALERLIRIDSLFARGRYALERACSRPAIVDRGEAGFRIFNGRHPLLLETAARVVPFELIMGPGEHMLLITGPNAGGKTVLIKAVGLISAMTQSGLLPPVGPGSELPVYSDIFADIGDEQSIDASLSTFTAHLRNLTELIDRADAGALCLIDEIGGATDPVEGTALARALLLELAGRGAMTLATSHLGGLKTLPGECPGIASAGLGFDAEKLEPLYALTKGRPGRSYALAMARRVGLPDAIVDAAEASLSQSEVDTERLLADLEAKERELQEQLEIVSQKEGKLAELETTLARQGEELVSRQQALETEGRQQAREFLLEARKQVDEVLKSRRQEADAARSALEASLREHTAALRTVSGRKSRRVERELPPLGAGDFVFVETLGREGKVVEKRGEDYVVEVGGVKLHMPPDSLTKLESPDEPPVKVGALTEHDADAHSEVDFRGLTAEEARMELIRAVDAAVQAGLPTLRVVHGKGTGVLRAAVAEYVKHDRRVRSHRMGAPYEGGSGVTVLELE